MTERKEKLSALADRAEEIGLPDVAEMLRLGVPEQRESHDKSRMRWRLEAILVGIPVTRCTCDRLTAPAGWEPSHKDGHHPDCPTRSLA